MTEWETQRQLRRMPNNFTLGSILHLLAEAFRVHVEQAQADNNPRITHQCDLADSMLFVIGMGIDAACPR